jgi:hypothetical protein
MQGVIQDSSNEDELSSMETAPNGGGEQKKAGRAGSSRRASSSGPASRFQLTFQFSFAFPPSPFAMNPLFSKQPRA